MEHLLSSLLKPPHLKFSMKNIPRIKAAFPNVQLSQHCEDGVPFTFYFTHSSQPTIVYVHSYNSSRHEVNTLLPSMLAGNFNVATIDLQRVNTEYAPSSRKHIDRNGIITFGYCEFEQIRKVVMFLSRTVNTSIILWGRSMGAACVINYQYKYRDAKCIILDSPFADLRDAFTKRFSATIPQCICSGILSLVTSSINSFAGVNLLDMNFLGKMDSSTPTIFIHSKHDPLSGCQELYNACKNHSKIILFTETHHCEQREPEVIQDILKILGNLASRITQRQENSIDSTSISLTPRTKKKSFATTDYLDRSVEMTNSFINHSATDRQLTSCHLNSMQCSRDSKTQTGPIRLALPQSRLMRRLTICSNQQRRLVKQF